MVPTKGTVRLSAGQGCSLVPWLSRSAATHFPSSATGTGNVRTDLTRLKAI